MPILAGSRASTDYARSRPARCSSDIRGGMFAIQDPSFASYGVQNWINRLGFFGIAVFFVISGFLLSRPFALASLAGRRAPRLLPFWKRRFFRIFPRVLGRAGVAVFVFGQAQFESLGQGVTVFALAQT